MKIAIFFLLVGLCSCNDSLRSCSGTVTLSQAETLSTLVVMMACKYEESKGKANNVYDKVCLMDLAITIVKLLSAYLKCDRAILIKIVVECLDVPSDIKLIIKESLEKCDPLLVITIDVSLDKIMKAICCVVEAYVGKVLFGNLVNTVLSLLSSVLDSLLLESLAGLLGGLLDLIFTPVIILGSIVFEVTDAFGGLLTGVIGLLGGREGGLLGGSGGGLLGGSEGGLLGGSEGGLLSGGGDGLIGGLLG
ncbi:uncharacterized protein [Eleutherodactylus coqui]|uniref:uncharacterized protein n=1 Tax=Eleutherodactylus coqui TaxID=57060 RepID=UPI0034634416